MASTTYRVCTLPGDGIGPEIMAEAKKVLAAVGEKHDIEFVCEDHLIGGAAIDATSEAGGPVSALPPETLEAARAADAVLLAAVGGPKWTDTKVGAVRPEQGLLAIRKELGLYLNLRPVRMFDALIDASTLYFGGHERTMGVEGAGVGGGRGEYARDVLEYSEYEVDRVVRWAFDAARRRRGVVHSVDKANVLDTSRMWREVAHNIAREYPDVRLEDMYVDNAAMQLIANPAQFDVLVTENTFGDILSDEASMLTGSLGMLASASLGDGTALYEPSHGSAPDIAGQGIANPIAQILSVELMLRYSFGMDDAADELAAAVTRVLDEGWRTADIADEGTPAEMVLGTAAMGDKIVTALG